MCHVYPGTYITNESTSYTKMAVKYSGFTAYSTIIMSHKQLQPLSWLYFTSCRSPELWLSTLHFCDCHIPYHADSRGYDCHIPNHADSRGCHCHIPCHADSRGCHCHIPCQQIWFQRLRLSHNMMCWFPDCRVELSVKSICITIRYQTSEIKRLRFSPLQ